MPTQILVGKTGRGPGQKVCTLTGGTFLSGDMKLGPDGDLWSVYSHAEITGLVATITKLRHIGQPGFDHICAQKSSWAFEVFASSRPHGVAFVHSQISSKLQIEDGPGVYWFTKYDLLQSYNAAHEASRAPRIWQRSKNGMTELALNFCLKKYG